jgi:hypothetical protein
MNKLLTYKNISLYNINIVLPNIYLFYIEHNKKIYGNILSISKIKLFFYCVYNLNGSYKFFLFSNMFFILYMKINKYINILYETIKSTIFGYKAQYKIIGRGYKIYKKANHYFLRLGYPITFFFSPSIFYRNWIKKKSKIKNYSKKNKLKYYNKLYTIGSLKKNIYLNQSILQFFRLPDIYSKKGIFLRNKKVFFKEGKKAYSL